MFRFLVTALLIGIGCVSTGCVRGILYTDVVEPYDLNMNRTPVGTKFGKADLSKFTEPFSRAQISVELSSNSVGDAMNSSGLERAYYADLHRQSFLFGIWQRNTIYVYGD